VGFTECRHVEYNPSQAATTNSSPVAGYAFDRLTSTFTELVQSLANWVYLQTDSPDYTKKTCWPNWKDRRGLLTDRPELGPTRKLLLRQSCFLGYSIWVGTKTAENLRRAVRRDQQWKTQRNDVWWIEPADWLAEFEDAGSFPLLAALSWLICASLRRHSIRFNPMDQGCLQISAKLRREMNLSPQRRRFRTGELAAQVDCSACDWTRDHRTRPVPIST